jgi:hypothetical protein
MRAVRIKTDDRLLIWSQLFKLECAALHKQITSAATKEGSEASCQAATVVYRHAVSDLSEVGKVDMFKRFAAEAFDALETSTLGYKAPADLEQLRDTIRHSL